MIIKHELIIDKEVVLSLIQHKRDMYTVDEMRDGIIRGFYPVPKEYIKYPCWVCEGRGKIKDPDDRDPVEGMKLASLIKCNLCDGKKEVDKALFLDHVKRANNSAKSNDDEFKDVLDKCIKLYSKLTFEEAKFITLSNLYRYTASCSTKFDKVIKHDIKKIQAEKEALATAMKEGILKSLSSKK